jgi:hypothetical protein
VGAVPAASLPPLPWVACDVGAGRGSCGVVRAASLGARLPLTTSRASLTTSLACAGSPPATKPSAKQRLIHPLSNRDISGSSLANGKAHVAVFEKPSHSTSVKRRIALSQG